MSVMNMLPAKKLFEQASIELNMDAAVIEKDWYVVQVLSSIAAIQTPGFEIIFSGGTALSKAHRLLQRFSEDIDFRVISSEAAPSRSTLSNFKHSVIKGLQQGRFTIDENTVRARDNNRFFAIDIDYDTHFTRADALRPHIQLEITINSPRLPAVLLPVQSFLTELMQKPAEVPGISCLAAIENAADKLSALAWRIPDRMRGGQYDDPAVVRHIHDLAILEPIAMADSKQFVALVRDAASRDNDRPKNNAALNGLSVSEKFSAMFEILSNDSAYPKEYDRFVRGVCYGADGEVPSYAAALEAVRRLTLPLKSD